MDTIKMQDLFAYINLRLETLEKAQADNKKANEELYDENGNFKLGMLDELRSCNEKNHVLIAQQLELNILKAVIDGRMTMQEAVGK